jgi:uncharacterized protein (DUF305 family)
MLKNLILKGTLPLVLVLAMSSCDDSDDGLIVQDHDKNEFMTIMHNMNAQMDAMEMTGDADHDFASMMIVHHQGAIDMATLLLKKGDDEVIRSMAEHLISEQQAEQQKLNEFVKTHTPEPSEIGQEYNNEMMKSMEKSKNLKDIVVLTGDADEDFAQLMIVHHQTANDNAQAIIHHSHHQEIIDMAKTMSADQTQEMIELSDWLIENRNIQNAGQ